MSFYFDTKDQAITAIFGSMPYSHQIKDLDSTTDAIYFTWRGDRYKVQLSPGSVYTVIGGCLHGDEKAILIERIISNYTLKS